MKTILVDAVGTLVIEGEGVFEDMHTLLETYPHKKIILTNADDTQIVEFGLTDVPYELFTCKHQPNKTDSLYFEKMLTRFNLQADDVIYFEHDPVAVKSAESVGIVSYHYNETEKNLRTLKCFLDENL